jgi:hypothetical protein
LDCSGTSLGGLYVAQFSSTGAYAWAYAGGASDSIGTSLAFGPSGSPVLGGTFSGAIDIAGTTVTATGGASNDALLATFSP